jgi:hypothetical protein
MVQLASNQTNLSIYTARGQLDSSEIVATYRAFIEQGPTPLVLWDITAATLAGLSVRTAQDLARQLVKLNNGRRKGGRSAVVCSRETDFGIANLLIAYARLEGHPVLVQTFRSAADATRWLTQAHAFTPGASASAVAHRSCRPEPA